MQNNIIKKPIINNMTPKEKAEDFFEKLYNCDSAMDFTSTKQCALIAVDEILSVINRDTNYQNVYAYFLEVKQEIEKL